MSAATEYYGYLLSQGYGEYQLNLFANYAQRANRGEISHNQAYRLARKEGFGEVNDWDNVIPIEDEPKKQKKSFGDWMQTAQDAGWIDQVINIFKPKPTPSSTGGEDTAPPPPPPPPKTNTMVYVIGGAAVIGIGIAIYFAVKK